MMPTLNLLFCILSTAWFATSVRTEGVWPTSKPEPRHPPWSFHISDFTDPRTGINPFVHIKEGVNHPQRPPIVTSSRPPSIFRARWPTNPVEGDVPYRPRSNWHRVQTIVPPLVNVPGTLPPRLSLPHGVQQGKRGQETFESQKPEQNSSAGTDSPDVLEEEEDLYNTTPLSEATLWTLLLCGILLICALTFFASLLAVCVYKQQRKRVITRKPHFVEEGKAASKGQLTGKPSKNKRPAKL